MSDIKNEIKNLQEELSILQQKIRAEGIPVIIVVDGVSASGKGSAISKITAELEPRAYMVYADNRNDPIDHRRHFLTKYRAAIPAQGHMALFERGWYLELDESRYSVRNKQKRLNEINIFERQLHDNGYLIMKFFLSLSAKTQRKRFEKLEERKSTSWLVTENDWKQNEHFDVELAKRKELLEETSNNYAEWEFIDSNDKDKGTLELLKAITSNINKRLEGHVIENKPKDISFTLNGNQKLTYDQKSKPNYEYIQKQMKKERKKIRRLHSLAYKEKVSVVLVFEGWDAAGKGGAIRRLSWALDPRGFAVSSIAAPSAEEAARHYLWRFWTKLPKDGHISIFDRSWYGRVMVERIEGFTKEKDWRRAYREINEFEQSITDRGTIVIKFWIHVNKDTQLERFNERMNTPEKQYKITDEDWRNREKWGEYEVAVNEMLSLTSTKKAPWVIIDGNDKKSARLAVIEAVRRALEEKMN